MEVTTAPTLKSFSLFGHTTEWQRTVAVSIILSLVTLLGVLFVVPHFQHQLGAIYQVGRVDNYYSLAKDIRTGHGYRFTPDTALTLMREPGYPYLLASTMFVDNYADVAIALNIALTCLSALLVASLSRDIWRLPLVAIVAATLFLLHPGVIIADARIGVESVFTFLLLCFFYLLRRALQTDRFTPYGIAGLALGLTCLVRSTPLLFPIPLLAYQLVRNRGARGRRTVAQFAALSFATFLVLSPWIVRNYRLVHAFIPTASVRGIAMQTGQFKCVHEGTGKSYLDLDKEAAQARNTLAAAAGYRFSPGYYQFFQDPRDEVAFSGSLSKAAILAYERSPSLLAKCAGENLIDFWIRGNGPLATIGAACVQVPYLILAAFGLWRGYRAAEQPTLMCLLLFVGYLIALCLPIQAQARYSVPTIPIIAILCALPVTSALRLYFGASRSLTPPPDGRAAAAR